MPIYIKYGGLGDEHAQDVLNDAFLKIDTDFQKLSSADGTAAFLKLESDHAIKHDIFTIGSSFHKLSDDFLKIADGAYKLDAFVIKLTSPTTTSDAEVNVGVPAVQSDFLKLDTALKTSASDLSALGSDFVKLDTAPDLESFKIAEQKISTDFFDLSADHKINAGTFTQLGSDLIALGAGPNSKEVDQAYKLLGGELIKVAPAFDALALDWQKLGQDFATMGGGGGAGTSLLSAASADQGPAPSGPLGSDFLKLEHDFLLLNQAIGGTLPGTFKVLDALFDQSGKESNGPLTEHVLGGNGGFKSG
jgi:hypothetical protein